MNASETIQVIAALRASGATHFKSGDFEITLIQGAAPFEQSIPPIPKVQAQSPLEPISIPVENKDAIEKVNSLINTLKMPDEQLVDMIFPAGAGG